MHESSLPYSCTALSRRRHVGPAAQDPGPREAQGGVGTARRIALAHRTPSLSPSPSHTLAQALSDFAEYVEQQQSLRFPASRPGQSAAAAAVAGPPALAHHHDHDHHNRNHHHHHHEELDELFEKLQLDNTAPRIPLRDLLLGSDDESLARLGDVVWERLVEGMGETVFELGYENSGDSMKLTPEQWHAAHRRLVAAAKGAGADCELLLTRNVGGDVEAAVAARDACCSAKVLVRRVPSRPEDVIETRIAVVGNGEPPSLPPFPPAPFGPAPPRSTNALPPQWTRARARCWGSWSRATWTMGEEGPG